MNREKLTVAIVRQLTERIMPAACLLCGGPARDGGVLCPDCLADLPHTGPACPACGAPQMTMQPCGRCQAGSPPCDRTLAAFQYAAPVDQMIHSFKYRGSLLAARALTPALGELIRRHADPLPQIMLPVPLHRTRLCRRGFNQSLEIARALQRHPDIDIGIDAGLIRRHRATREQARLDPAERRRNLKNAFLLTRPCDYHSVAIIDDVITTGTTAGELAQLLRRAGVKHIQVWALARAGEQ